MKRFINIVVLMASLMVASSCREDFLDVETTSTLTSKSAEQAILDDPAKVAGFVNSIYPMMVSYGQSGQNDHDVFGIMSILHATDMMSEDIVQDGSSFFYFDYLHDYRDAKYKRTFVMWSHLYSIVSSANIALSLTSSTTSSKEIQAYRGQAFALRGMAYYYLIQLYQNTSNIVANTTLPGIPLYYAPNEGKANQMKRVPVAEVFAQIESDLSTAVSLLTDWQRPTKNQVDYAVANGLLARYYMLSGQWQKAIDAALLAGANSEIMNEASLHDGFMKIENAEWIWGFDHDVITSTYYASFFSHISNISPGYAGLGYSPRLIDKRLYESISASDERKSLFQGATQTIDSTELLSSSLSPIAIAWKKPYASLKFGFDGNWSMDYVYMRKAEMVLIEAEALAHLNKNTEAATALAKLMTHRDPAWSKSSVTVDEVWMERRIELWGEGFAYFDLKRLKKGIDRNYPNTNHRPDARLTKTSSNNTWIFQIPQTELQENTEITEADQNL